MLLLIEYICYLAYPFIGLLAWGIILYQHIKYGRRIRELEKFKQDVELAIRFNRITEILK